MSVCSKAKLFLAPQDGASLSKLIGSGPFGMCIVLLGLGSSVPSSLLLGCERQRKEGVTAQSLLERSRESTASKWRLVSARASLASAGDR